MVYYTHLQKIVKKMCALYMEDYNIYIKLAVVYFLWVPVKSPLVQKPPEQKKLKFLVGHKGSYIFG